MAEVWLNTSNQIIMVGSDVILCSNCPCGGGLPDAGSSCATATVITAANAGNYSSPQTFDSLSSGWYSFSAGVFSSFDIDVGSITNAVNQFSGSCASLTLLQADSPTVDANISMNANTVLLEISGPWTDVRIRFNL